MVNLQQSAAQASPEQREKLAALKTDPELKMIFDDIEANGPSKLEPRAASSKHRQANGFQCGPLMHTEHPITLQCLY